MKKKKDRRRVWEDAQVKKGRCARCGQKRKKSRRYCDLHLALDAERKRLKLGLSVWEKGKPGRPPLTKFRVSESI